MKKTAYRTGLISSLVIYLGAMFKIQHWPGASIMLTLGIACLVLVFVPFALTEHYRNTDGKKNLWLHIVTFFTCLVVFTGALFKIMHWPYAGILLVFSIPFPFILFLPVFIYTSNRNKAPITDYISVLILLLFYAVFSSLLSINISRNILDEGILSSREWTNIERVYHQSMPQPAVNPVDLKNPNQKELQSILVDGDKLCDEITELIKTVAISVSLENKTSFDPEGNIHFEYLNRQDAITGELDLFRNDGKGVEMINHLKAFQTLLLSAEGLKTSPVKDLAREMLDTNPTGEEPWDESHVLRLPLVWEINSLQSIKAAVRICQAEAINAISKY